MKHMCFDLEEKKLASEIKNRKPKIVLLQLPEGLKPEAPRLASIIEKAEALPIVSSDPCYGACDLAISEAKLVGADLIVHYGHTPMTLNSDVPIVYIEARAKISVKEAVIQALSYLEDWKKIGLVTTVQHIHQLEKVKRVLLDAGKIVFVQNAGHVKYSGQVLGCDFSNAQGFSEKVEAVLFVGGGRFHAIGTALASGKPTIIADPYQKIAYRIDDQVKRIIMQRWASICEAKQAKSFGVLVSLKSGQMKLKAAVDLKRKLEEKGFAATLFTIREVSRSALMQFPRIDAFVNTACPRLSLDDVAEFGKPLLSVSETLIILEELTWEKLLRKGWFGNVI